jgi:hypothetical protein
MVAVPGAIPLTTPVDETTVATKVLLLLHDPPEVALLSVVVLDIQRVVVPVIGVNPADISVMLTVISLHLSPASANVLLFTKLITARIDTVPVPAAGAVQGIFTT